MTVEYTWTIYKMTVVPEMDVESLHFQDVVTEIWWAFKASGGGYVMDKNGSVTLPPPAMAYSKFDQLTLVQVLEWTRTLIGEERIEEMKEELASSINRLLNPPVIYKLPSAWKTSSVSHKE